MKKKYYYKINYADGGYDAPTRKDTEWWDVIFTDTPKTNIATLHPRDELWDYPLEASTDASVMVHEEDRFVSLSNEELKNNGKRLSIADIFILKI
jgi:hypothetical protein